MKRSPCSRPVRSIRVEMLCAPLCCDSPRPRQMCLFVKILISEIVTFLMPCAASSESQIAFWRLARLAAALTVLFMAIYIFLAWIFCTALLGSFAGGFAFCSPGLSGCAEGVEGLTGLLWHPQTCPEPSLYGMDVVTSSFKHQPWH